MMVDRALTRLQQENPDLKVERVDIVANLRRAMKEGIRMIPALKDGDRILSGIFLSKKEIEDFIAGR